MESQQAQSWANYMPPKCRWEQSPTSTTRESAGSASTSYPWDGRSPGAPAATPNSKGHTGYGSAGKERTQGPRDGDKFLPPDRKEVAYLKKFRTDIERDTKDVRDSY